MIKDRVFSITLILFLGLMYMETFKFDEKTSWQAFSSASYPRVLILLIAIPTIVLLYKSFKPVRTKQDSKKNLWKEYKNIVYLFAFFGIYTWLLELIGFIPATILYLFASQAVLMGMKKRKEIVLNSTVSLITPVVVYLIFTNFLQVWLP